jgi:hypothetical protein
MSKILYLLCTKDPQNSLMSRWVEYDQENFESVKIFYKNLINKFKNKITFRIGQKSYNYISINKYEFELGEKVKIDYAIKPFNRIKNDYDLIIIGYESTAIYELLAYKKIPFLILISKKYFNCLNKESQKDFLILFKKKILFFSEKKLAGEINRNYYKIINTWKKKISTKSMVFFCNKYAKYEKFKFLKLKKILDNLSKNFIPKI